MCPALWALPVQPGKFHHLHDLQEDVKSFANECLSPSYDPYSGYPVSSGGIYPPV